ncbi:MAG: hypothetical protein JSS44_01625 [Proteobacteria bacterium]|nr:hypothetical protein [Pseudomonadota bacterium]
MHRHASGDHELRETHACQRIDPSDPSRRRLLAGLVAAYTASLIPWAMAVPVTDAEHGTFVALSAILVGRRMLDAEQGRRLHDALAAIEPGFDADCQVLLNQIDSQRIDPAMLQSVLDAGHANVAPLPRKIMRAWCLGLVGEGEATRCLAYEQALDAVVVGDVLRPPTYAYGAYGSWSRPPASKE